jgi:hypothetical protein
MILRNPKLHSFVVGRYPRTLAYVKLYFESRNPDSYISKIRHRLARDRRPMLTELSDKYAVRSFVREKLGEQYLSKLYGTWSPGEKLDLKILPEEFVAKSNHGVGASLIVWRGARSKPMELPAKGDDWDIHFVNPRDFSPKIAERFFAKWMSQRFDRSLLLYPTWAYRDIKPKVIFEELLLTPLGRIPNEYRFFCFEGICKLIEVDVDRFGTFSKDFYSPDWEPLQANLINPNSEVPTERPPALSEMIEISEILSAGMDFVTVDLFHLGDRIVFRELSFYHGGGDEKFSPESFDQWVGSLWTLPSRKK